MDKPEDNNENLTQDQIKESNRNIFIRRTKVINILLLGNSHTGKTTIVETLLCPSLETNTKATTYSRTFDPYKINLSFEYEMCNYQINIIDTPGFKESRKNNTRKDNAILELIKTVLRYDINEFHVVAFVIPVENNDGHYSKHKETFNWLKSILDDRVSQYSLLIITKSDTFSPNTMNQKENEIKDALGDFFNYCTLGVCQVGVIDNNSLDLLTEDNRRGERVSRLKRIADFRENLLGKLKALNAPAIRVDNLWRRSLVNRMCSMQ